MNRISKYFADRKAEKERLEEEARIEEEEKKQAAKEKAAKRKLEKEKKAAEEEEQRQIDAILAQRKLEEDEKEAAQKAFLEKLAKEKKLATENGEPWVALVTMDVDYANLNNGAFELDWNDAFVARLMKFGFQGKTDSDLVDQWFTSVCRNVVMETYEQEQANLRPIQTNDLGNGKREYK